MNRIGDQVKAVRGTLNLTQQELALRAGVARRTVFELEQGGSITLVNLEKILRSVGLSLVAQPIQPAKPTLDNILAENEEEDSQRFRP
jgi:transcriptional regulator with XRE-family HTH domain